MSAADQDGAGVPATDAAAPSTVRQVPSPTSPEFFLRVNDFIQMANRVERRYDSHHAQVAFLHAFARYSAHNYRVTTRVDDAESRRAFSEFIGDAVRQLVLGHLQDMVGDPKPEAAAASSAPEAGTDAPTPEA